MDVYSAKRSVLVVEDNEINREMLKEILDEQYRVIEAEDGVEGLEKLRENLADLSLILLDVQMPRMNGYEFLQIYSNDKMLSSVPVIVTTGSTITEDEEKCLAMGASDFVNKPYNPRIIIRRMEAIIRLRESMATLKAVEYDSLSGLYNRNAFRHYAENLLAHNDREFCMVMLNVEDFGYINERYGETRGDEVLKKIASEMQSACNKNAMLCRYHGDRFVMLFPQESMDYAKLISDLDESIHQSELGRDLVLKYSVYENVPHDTTISVLCDRLTLTVDNIARQYTQQIALYDEKMAQATKRRRLIAEHMEEALREEQFKVYYQPKHDPMTGKITGAEALVRWIHPVLGFISPGDFIPVFEENGFITAVDLYVLKRVCMDIKKWKEMGLNIVPVSVNASRRDIINIDNVSILENILQEYGVEKKYIHVEITESLFMNDERVFSRIQTLDKHQFIIELDDFGSGYSSLAMIKNIPMKILKLDISFARAIEKQKEVVKMIISLAHELSLETVAEGVENDTQLGLLKEYGCDYIQGYYYSKPLPEAEFTKYLKEHA